MEMYARCKWLHKNSLSASRMNQFFPDRCQSIPLLPLFAGTGRVRRAGSCVAVAFLSLLVGTSRGARGNGSWDMDVSHAERERAQRATSRQMSITRSVMQSTIAVRLHPWPRTHTAADTESVKLFVLAPSHLPYRLRAVNQPLFAREAEDPLPICTFLVASSAP
jgi:hypothetical protein